MDHLERMTDAQLLAILKQGAASEYGHIKKPRCTRLSLYRRLATRKCLNPLGFYAAVVFCLPHVSL